MSTDSGINLDEVRNFLDKKVRDRKARIKSRFEQAEKDFTKIVEYVISEFNPKRIYQWGSLLSPERFSEISDIDIAVYYEGSKEERFRFRKQILGRVNDKFDIQTIFILINPFFLLWCGHTHPQHMRLEFIDGLYHLNIIFLNEFLFERWRVDFYMSDVLPK